MEAAKVGHGFGGVRGVLVDKLHQENGIPHDNPLVEVDADFCLSVLKGRFIENIRWKNTLMFLNENRVKTHVITNCSDFRMEREILLTHTQQFVQAFAAKYGFTFMFYDYWHGLNKYNEMSPLEFRQVEKNFQKQMSQTVGSELKNSIMHNAIGPGGILFHSEMYGENVLPEVITAKQFKILLEAASSVGMDGKTLREWYELDEQSNPPVFELKDVGEIHKLYRSHRKTVELGVLAEELALWLTSKTVLNIEFNAGVSEMGRRKLISADHVKILQSSSVEFMMRPLLSAKDPNEKVVVFSRKFDRIKEADDIVSEYLDLELGLVSPANRRKSTAVLNFISQTVPAKRMRKKVIQWMKNGVSDDNLKHRPYLSYVETQSYLDVTRRISAAHFHQSSVLGFFKSDSLKNLFLECAAQIFWVILKTEAIVSRDGIVETIFDTIIENKQPSMSLPVEFSADDDWLEWGVTSEDCRSARPSRPFSLTFSLSNKKTSTPVFSRGTTLSKLRRSNTKEKFKLKSREKKDSFDIVNVAENTNRGTNMTSRGTQSSRKEEKKVDQSGEIEEELIHESDFDEPDFDPTGEQLWHESSLEHSPFFIVGDNTSGKTTLAAMLVKYAESYMPGYYVISKFCGITDQSKSFLHVIESLTHIMARLYKLDFIPSETLDETIQNFQEIVEEVCKSNKVVAPLMIVVDQLDALTCRNSETARKLKWLPNHFTNKIKFIFTVNRWDVLLMKAAKIVSRESWRFFELPSHLSLYNSRMYLEDIMLNKKRTLTQSQKTIVTRSLGNQPTMSFFGILANQAVTWRKRFKVPCRNFTSVSHLINVCYIEKAVKKFGKELIKYLAVFLCASKLGLSEIEILDLLSYEDSVMNEAFTSLGFFKGSVARFPLFLWTKIKVFYDALLEERKVDGCFLLSWKKEEIRKTFTDKFFSHSNHFVAKIRRHLLEYFRGQLNTIKSLKLKRGDFATEMMGADRCIQKQRLKHAKGIYNVRAMNEIFYQLQQLGDANLVVDYILDFQTLLYNLRAQPVEIVVNQMTNILLVLEKKQSFNSDLHWLLNFLKENEVVLQQKAENLVQLLKDSADKIVSSNLEKLRQDSFIWFHRSTTPRLLVQNQQSTDSGNSQTKDSVITPIAEINFGPNDMPFKRMFATGQKNKLILSPEEANKLLQIDLALGTMYLVESEAPAILNYYPLDEQFGLCSFGKEWHLMSHITCEMVNFSNENTDAMEDSPEIIPCFLNSQNFALKHHNFDPIKGDFSEDFIDESLLSAPVVEMFSFKTKQWYLLPDLDVWQSEKVLFICPFVESVDSVKVVYILDNGQVVVFYEEVEWQLKTLAEEGSEEGGDGGEGDEGSDDFANKERNANTSKFSMEEVGDANKTELNFKESNAQDEFEVRVVDEPQDAPEEQEVKSIAEIEYADTVDSVSGVWKQVKTVHKKVLRIDVSNDPINANEMPILYANLLIFRTEAALVLVDLIQVMFTRIYIDELHDCDIEKGLLLVKANEFTKCCIFSIESQKPIVFLEKKEFSMKFVPGQGLILGQSGSSISVYRWTLGQKFVERIFNFADPLINPQLPAVVELERLVVFTELGVVMYNLTQILSEGPRAQFAPLDKLYFKREDGSVSPSSGVGSMDTVNATDCFENFVAVAKLNSLSIYSLNKSDSRLTLELLHELDYGSQFSGFLHIRKHQTQNTESLKIFMTLKTGAGIQLVKFSTKTNVMKTVLENLPDESNIWAREDYIAVVADQNLKVFDTVNNEVTYIFRVGNVKDMQLVQVEGTIVPTWLERNYLYVSGNLLHEVAQKVGEPKKLLPSMCNNAPVVIFLEESSKVQVLIRNQLFQIENKFKVVNLEFKHQVQDVAVVTSTKILIYESFRIHTLDLHKEEIVQTCNLSLDSKPLLSYQFNFNKSDFRIAVFLYKDLTGFFISIVNTLTGNILATTGIDGSQLESLEEVEIKASSCVRVLTLKTKSSSQRNCSGVTASKIVVSNPALESSVSKILMEFPQEVKNAYSIASEFSPLRKETFKSTRPMNILVE